MRKAVGIILGIGLVAVGMSLLSLMMGMGSLADSPAGNRIRVAADLKKEFGYGRVTSDALPTSPDLVFTIHVQAAKDAPRPNPAEEDDARLLYAQGRMDLTGRRLEEGEENFRKLEERYPNSSARADLRCFRAAAFIKRTYAGGDRANIGKIIVKLRTTRGTGPDAVAEERSISLEMGTP